MSPAPSYKYPSADAQFELYNLHEPQLVAQVAEALGRSGADGQRVMHVCGAEHSGRLFLLRSAAHRAAHVGRPVTVEAVDLDGYEPGQPLGVVVRFLARKAGSAEAGGLIEAFLKQAKVEVKLTPVNFTFASLSLKWDPSAKDLLEFLSAMERPQGPPMPEREQLRHLLERFTRGSLVLFFRDGRVIDVGFRERLMDEMRLNPKLLLAFGYPAGSTAGAEYEGVATFHVASWTREAMQSVLRQRMPPGRFPALFVDFVWDMAGGDGVASRESVAGVLLRLMDKSILREERPNEWRLAAEWAKEELVRDEFTREMFEPILEVRSRLRADGDTVVLARLEAFLLAAALCHPTIPVARVIGTIGVPEEERDDFMDFLDESLGEDGAGVLEDLGFVHPGFGEAGSISRFANPLLPPAILQRRTKDEVEAMAVRLVDALQKQFRPETRAVARLLLRVAEHGGVDRLTEECQRQLAWWVDVEETEELVRWLHAAVRKGLVWPELLWGVVQRTENIWAPARRLALLEAYGAQRGGIPDENRLQYLATASDLYYQVGQYEKAVKAAQSALSGSGLRWFSEWQLRTLLGRGQRALGDLGKARAEFQRGLDLVESHGQEAPSALATALHSLAALCVYEGRYSEAIPLFERALAIREDKSGPNDDRLAATLNNYARLLVLDGRYSEARPLYERALAILEEVLGPTHPDVAFTLNNLAELHTEEGRYAQAIPLFERALSIRERVLGPNHPNVAVTLNNLASSHFQERRFSLARPLCERALAILQQRLGDMHPEVAATLSNLARLHVCECRYSEARPLYERALRIREGALGSHHPDVAATVVGLAQLDVLEGRYAEARPLFARALAIHELVFGPNHIEVADVLLDMVQLAREEGRDAEADALQQRADAIGRQGET